MWTAGFPEPRTFSRRVLRLLRERAGDFDVVHDNQTLGSALLDVEEATGLPLVVTVHHPISIDRRIDLAAAPDLRKRLTLRRWYGFVRMQARVAKADADGADAVGVLRARRRPRVRGRPGPRPGGAARRRRQLRAADRAARPRPDPGDGQRRRAAEGHRDPARGVRQAAHGAPRARAAAGHQADRRAAGPSGCSTSSRSATTCASCTASATTSWSRLMGSAEVACVPEPLRGLLAADRRADGDRDAARGLAGRRDPRGRRARRAVRRPGHARATSPSWSRPWAPCSTTPSAVPATARPGAAGSRSCSAGGPPRPRPPRPTTRRSPTHRARPADRRGGPC